MSRALLVCSTGAPLRWIAALALLWSTQAVAGQATVAVATNFKYAMGEIEAAFEAATDHQLTVATASTGKLYAQARHGAPYDVVMAADQLRPKRLIEDGLAVPGSRFTYAIGELVLWSPRLTELSAQSLASTDYRFLAIANPDLAPYGAAAMQALEGLGLSDSTSQRLVLGENIGQTFAFVQTGNAELGLVALSQVLALPESQRGAHWRPPASSYAPIRQDMVLLKRGQDNPAATALFGFLRSAEAAAIIEPFGYRVE